MKTPPFLLGAGLIFWGWQTGFLPAGIVMALVLEGSRLIKERWEFSDEDFTRIWTFCTLVFLGVTVYAFTDNGGPMHFNNFLRNPGTGTQNSASIATSRTASAILRWLPMVLFLFVVAQAYSSRVEIPLRTLSLILRRQWKRAQKLGQPPPPALGFNAAYPYFGVCVFAASVHASDDTSYFWGLCALITWALWTQRTRRFAVLTWGVTLAAALTLGYFGQQSIGQLQTYLQNLDPNWLARFMRRGVDPSQTKTQIGSIGELKMSGKIVIRVEPKDGSEPPVYLREASYRQFAAPAWKMGTSKIGFETVPPGGKNTTWLLFPEKITTAKAGITCYLEGQSRESRAPAGFLPLPTGVGQLENLPVFSLKKNNFGAVLAEGPGLVIFDALYGPGVTMDMPPSNATTNNEDLIVPSKELPAIIQAVEELQLTNRNITTSQTLRAIQGWFENNFHYSTYQKLQVSDRVPFRKPGSARTEGMTNDTALARFLLRTRAGHCEYFATATVLMLRQLGIPARYAIGYVVHESSSAARTEYVVRLRDAHAWCLVWNEETKTWRDFDTTPAGWIEEEAKNASPFQKLSDLWSWLGFQFSKFRWGQSNVRQYLLLSLIPVLILLLYQIFRQKRQRRGKQGAAKPPPAWPGLDSEFYLIERKLAARGIKRRENEPLSDWLQRGIAASSMDGTGDRLRALLRLHYRYRFDPQGLNGTDRETLKREARAALEALGK